MKKIFFVFPTLYFFVFYFSAFISCSSSRDCESAVNKGEWDNAVYECEKYYERVKLEDSAKNVSPEKEDEKVLEYFKAVRLLSSAYLGKAGFDWLKIADYVIEIAQKPSTQQVEISLKMKEFLFPAKTTEERNMKIRESMKYIFKAQRILSKALFGNENAIEDKKIEDVGEFLKTAIERSNFGFKYKLGREINNLEYLLGKILVVKVLFFSFHQGFMEFLSEKLKEGEKSSALSISPKSQTTLPSLCCFFLPYFPSPSSPPVQYPYKYPYNITSYTILDTVNDISSAIVEILNSLLKKERGDFQNFSKNISERVDEIIRDARDDYDAKCYNNSVTVKNIFYNRFFSEITKSINKVTQDYNVSVNVGEVGCNNDIWFCPACTLDDVLFDVLCMKEINWKIRDARFPQNITYRVSTGNRICGESQPRNPIYIDIGIKQDVPDLVFQNICSETARIIEDGRKLLALLEDSEKEEGGRFQDVVTRVNQTFQKLISDIVGGRGDPQICYID